MHMIRNPRGTSSYSMKWNSGDTFSWTDHFKSQVPMEVNPTEERTSKSYGIFFVEHKHLIECFQQIDIAHYREDQGYKHSWYDVEGDDGSYKSFNFTLDQKTIRPIYLTIETYMPHVVPNCQRCMDGGHPEHNVRLYRKPAGDNLSHLVYAMK